MAGSILPVIFIWHLKVQINAVAGETAGALDPRAFGEAWVADAAVTVDTFAPAMRSPDGLDQPGARA